MSSPQSSSGFAAFAFDSADLTRSAVSTIRVALGITGVLALIAGIFITFWPKNSAIVLTVLIGIYFLIAGLAYVGLGIFSKGLSGGARALDIILGVLFVIGGILMLTSPSESAVVLGIFLGVLVGILWIVEVRSPSPRPATRRPRAGRSSSACSASSPASCCSSRRCGAPSSSSG
ncbi:HdeD family acid-resistance protein [Agromyces sp. C10]|uniref:HdeD family acid-resistance protein n=1 Tax=Agromyces sp. C10 TaxID=2935077 RepID=UPI00200B742F|nr:DUF308 domain-containing protein [Agromyces sp. C10]MCK8609366.1 DUF308 domain-containing protein [Agromyces sp. C10]